MNPIRFNNWSERQQVLAVIGLAGLLIFGLWTFLLTPLNQRRQRLEQEISRMRAQLAGRNYLIGEDVLQQTQTAQATHHESLQNEWRSLQQRMAAFSSVEGVLSSGAGHIDYKIELFKARQRLEQKSRAMQIQLPPELGMEDVVRSNEDARKLMLQLRAIEKLVDLALDLHVTELGAIQPLPVIEHRIPGRQTVYLEEYPIHVELYARLENLYELFHSILKQEHVFVLKHVRIETPDPDGNMLLINTVMSALIFRAQPDELAPVETRRIFTAPQGF